MARTRSKRSASPASTSTMMTSSTAAAAVNQTPSPNKKRRTTKRESGSTEAAIDPLRSPKTEEAKDQPPSSAAAAAPGSTTPKSSASATLAKKLKQLESYQQTPFPDYKRPSAEECQAVCDALATMHKLPERPVKIERLDSVGAACGLVPNVLDALVRTILSQNTSNKNSTSARKGIEDVFGSSAHGGPNYEAVRQASQEQLMAAIQSGGLAKVKSKVIKTILDEVYDKYGTLSLEHLHTTPDQEAMKELVSFHGVGPKTASCVLLFTLSRESFAVDTHVFRITKALGWTPSKADRETAFQHLDVRIPGPLKYPLHSMLVRHGRECRNCAAGSSPTKDQRDKCPLKPFLGGKRPPKASQESEDGDEEEEMVKEEPASPSRSRKLAVKKEEAAEPDMHGL